MGTPRGRPEFPILEMLRAEKPHSAFRAKLMLFGQFVGVWDVEIMFYDEGGNRVYKQPGVWSFAWVLDGRAIQDVLVYPNPERGLKDTPGNRRIGTTIRFYDSEADLWRVGWFGVVTGNVGLMTGRQVGEEIWIEETEPDGTLTRWMFTGITSNQFRWKGMQSVDRGKSWRMQQEMLAQRRTA
jgi:hypothetical protein